MARGIWRSTSETAELYREGSLWVLRYYVCGHPTCKKDLDREYLVEYAEVEGITIINMPKETK